MLQQKREEERERLLTFLRLPSATKQKKKGFSSSSSLFLTFLHICTQRREGEEGGGEGVSGMPCMRLPPPSYMCVCFLPSDVAERGKHADKRELHMCPPSSPLPSCLYTCTRERKEGGGKLEFPNLVPSPLSESLLVLQERLWGIQLPIFSPPNQCSPSPFQNSGLKATPIPEKKTRPHFYRSRSGRRGKGVGEGERDRRKNRKFSFPPQSSFMGLSLSLSLPSRLI